jgi:hypothetical protein
MKKTQKKKTETKKQKKEKIGNKYVCGVCGLSVVVNENCCCDDACDLVCCGEQMALC